MRLRPAKHERRGASLVEAGIIFLVLLTFILGVIDAGLGVMESNVVSNGARQGARLATVHGTLASSGLGTWGPTTYGPVAATDSGTIAQAIAPYLTGLDLTKTTLTVQWLDGSTDPGNRVKVTVSYTYQPMTTFVLNQSITISATSTMVIAH
jgi:Flp pilus assembly protein TadG